jgi:predicted lactoylglutathione lyase
VWPRLPDIVAHVWSIALLAWTFTLEAGRPMTKMIFINLPVADLDRAMRFYEALGFVNNPHFTDDTAACMVWSEAINVMLLTHDKWRTFTSRPIPPDTSSEVLLAVSCENREAVDAMNELAAANGGTADINPVQDLGFMYNRNLADPDGHVWEAMWMDPAAMPSG